MTGSVLALTTAELGLITTMVVGVAAAGSPALTAWSRRRHERAMARSLRLYEQRRDTYRDVGRFLERQRLTLGRVAQPIGPLPDPPEPPTDDEWTELQARVVVDGSAEVQAKLEALYRAARTFSVAAATYQAVEQDPRRTEALLDSWTHVDAARTAAVNAIDAAEREMRDELAKL